MIYETRQTYVLIEYLAEITKEKKEEEQFIMRYQRNGWMDFSELRAIDSLHNEGTNTLVMGGVG